jgi:chromosome transmission fidelity protein 4
MADESRLEFSHGHLAGQTGLSFAFLQPAGSAEKEGNKNNAKPVHLITGGADCLTCLRTEESGFKQSETDINDHEEAITCLAANRIAVGGAAADQKGKKENTSQTRGHFKTDLFVTGSEDRFVKLYSYPDAVFETNATRFELPVRAVDFSPKGRLLAAGGDDEGVRILQVEEDLKFCKLVRTLRTVGQSVKSLRWDPEGVFISAVSADGTLQIWNAETGESVLTRKHVTHRFDASSPQCAHACWHPEGIFLICPGKSGDVSFMERLSWEEEFSLPSANDGEKRGHSGPVSCVEVSPNGLYVATSGLDRRVVVWDVKKVKPIASRSADAVVCNIRWHPFQNALALIDEEGSFAQWEKPIESNLPEPFLVEEEDEMTALKPSSKEGRPMATTTTSLLEDDEGQKKGKTSRLIEESSSEEGLSDGDDLDDLGAGKILEAASTRLPLLSSSSPPRNKMQKPFQPGATPGGASKGNSHSRRFLAYNMDGYISSMRGADFNSVEVVFHDVSTRTSRIPTLTDYYGFELGALGPKGTILASPEKGTDSPSVLMYRPFESWAAGSDWTCTFARGEEVKAVTVGASFAAAATQKYLRIYSLAGSPQMVMSIPGPVVALAANESMLVLVYHDAEPTHIGNGSYSQKLSFRLYDVNSERQAGEGSVCLSPGSELEWVGFSEDGILATCDNQGCIRGYYNAYGGSWVPLFSSENSRKAETEHHYIVGLSQKEVFCIITKSSKHFPQVIPRPIITNMPLQIPIVSDELSNKGLQGDLMQTRLRHSQHSYAVASQLETPLEVQVDKALLKLLMAAIKSDQLEKAFELASELNLQRSLRGALQIANKFRKRLLAEKITLLIQNRQSLLQVQKDNPLGYDSSQMSDLHQSPAIVKKTADVTGFQPKNENVFSRKRVASADMLSPKTPKNPFAR